MNRSQYFVTFTVLLGLGLFIVVYRAVFPGAVGPERSGLGSGPRSLAGPAATDSTGLADVRRELVQLKREVWAQQQKLAVGSPVSGDAPASATPQKPHPDPEARVE